MPTLVSLAASAGMALAAWGGQATPDAAAGCATIAQETAAIERQLETTSQAMATSMAGHAAEAVATNQARNAIGSVAGRLNWVAPGLGTAIDLAADKAANAATRAREAQIAGVRAMRKRRKGSWSFTRCRRTKAARPNPSGGRPYPSTPRLPIRRFD